MGIYLNNLILFKIYYFIIYTLFILLNIVK